MCTKNLWGALNERVEKKKLKKSMQRQETCRLRIVVAASIGLER